MGQEIWRACFLRQLFHVDALKKDPLPEMWRGLDAFEFWGTKRDGPEYMFHSDVEGRPICRSRRDVRSRWKCCWI